MTETEEEERNFNNVTTEIFTQLPVPTNAPRKKTDVANERWIYLETVAETIKGFNKLTLQSTINDYTDDHSYKNVAESD